MRTIFLTIIFASITFMSGCSNTNNQMSEYQILPEQEKLCILGMVNDCRWHLFHQYGFETETSFDYETCGFQTLKRRGLLNLNQNNIQDFAALIVDFVIHPSWGRQFDYENILPVLEELDLKEIFNFSFEKFYEERKDLPSFFW